MSEKSQAAADAVLNNLLDRRGIKQGLGQIKYLDHIAWQEIRRTLSEIIERKMV